MSVAYLRWPAHVGTATVLSPASKEPKLTKRDSPSSTVHYTIKRFLLPAFLQSVPKTDSERSFSVLARRCGVVVRAATVDTLLSRAKFLRFRVFVNRAAQPCNLVLYCAAALPRVGSSHYRPSCGAVWGGVVGYQSMSDRFCCVGRLGRRSALHSGVGAVGATGLDQS